MLQRFQGSSITVDVHRIGNAVHVVILTKSGQLIRYENYRHDSAEPAHMHFTNLCYSYDYIGFTREEVQQ